LKYEEFLETKQITDEKSGFNILLDQLNPMLFDWEKVIVRWAIARGRAALFEDCGLGKTIQQLEWANQIHMKEKEPILILAPLAVSEQTCREGKKFNIDVNICRLGNDICNGINITNYEKLHKFNPDEFIGIVLDECFPPDTPVDVFNIDNFLESKCIKDISIGDKIYNAGGIDRVYNIRKRLVDRAVQVKINGRRFICSENHPWFTLYGWQLAKDLQAGDCLVATEEAVRLVRGDFSTKVFIQQNGKILRNILLGEMADESKRNQRQGAQSDSSGQNREEKIGMVEKRASKGTKRIRKNCKIESNVGPNLGRKNDQNQQKTNKTRSKERQKAGFVRVESIKILEQGHPELEKYRDAEGNIYFYDIEATQHPSFSVNGCLVHNSGILKNFAGTTRNEIINAFQKTPYRLACTATPAPNDYMELGNHAEFLGVMTRSEMLATFFINDTKDTGTWRLKGHVKNNIFWKWMSSWAIMISKPSDIGFEDGKFLLPEIKYHEHIIKSSAKPQNGLLLETAGSLDERRHVRRETIELRSRAAADLINQTNDMWVCWCNLNDEGEAVTRYVDGAVEVAGRHSDETKVDRMTRFAIGDIKRIVTKPKIAGLGMNWQICHNAAFIGLSDSWEQFYQATRRIWRFGQKKKVNVHIFIEEREGCVLRNIQRKDEQARLMIQNMILHTRELAKKELEQSGKTFVDYIPKEDMRLPSWIK
jgi:hypothetical protein